MSRYHVGWVMVAIALIIGLAAGPIAGVIASVVVVVAIFVLAALPDSVRIPARRRR